MCRNDAFSTAYFNSWVEWMKRCPGILEKVAMLLEVWVPFCLPSLSLNSKQSPSALPLTSLSVRIYTDFALQNQSSQWRATAVTRSCSINTSCVTLSKEAEFELIPSKAEKTLLCPFCASLLSQQPSLCFSLDSFSKKKSKYKLSWRRSTEKNFLTSFDLAVHSSAELQPTECCPSFFPPLFPSYLMLYLKFPLRWLYAFSSMAKALVNLVKGNAVCSCLWYYGRTGKSLPVRGSRSFTSQGRWPLSILPKTALDVSMVLLGSEWQKSSYSDSPNTRL